MLKAEIGLLLRVLLLAGTRGAEIGSAVLGACGKECKSFIGTFFKNLRMVVWVAFHGRRVPLVLLFHFGTCPYFSTGSEQGFQYTFCVRSELTRKWTFSACPRSLFFHPFLERETAVTRRTDIVRFRRHSLAWFRCISGFDLNSTPPETAARLDRFRIRIQTTLFSNGDSKREAHSLRATLTPMPWPA